jgi:hypothetical protein
MTQPIHLLAEFWAVEVPTIAFGLMINNYADESELMYMLSMEDIADDGNSEETLITKELPKGSWQIICTTKEVTGNIAANIVEHFNNGVYRDYAIAQFDPCDEYMSCHLCATESLQSLLKSLGLNGPNYIIIKKK